MTWTIGENKAASRMAGAGSTFEDPLDFAETVQDVGMRGFSNGMLRFQISIAARIIR